METKSNKENKDTKNQQIVVKSCHQGQDEQHNQDIIYSNVKDVKIEQMKL